VSERFFSAEPITAPRVTLGGPEAHHLLHVMRRAIGQQVTLFDGSGAEFTAAVESLGRTTVDLQIIERVETDRELPFPLAIGVALPKGDRQKWLLEKLTELGITAIVPLVADRGVAQPTASALERLRRSVIEASKQCRRNRLLKIHQPQRWRDWLSNPLPPDDATPQSSDATPSILRRLVAHPGGKPLAQSVLTRPGPTCLAVGPEGGLSDAEIAGAVDAGWVLVDLGPRILRTETAAVSLAAAVALMSEPCSPA
jgi:16S rRNA (uracil1498-N3)-methyltransferase